MILRQIVDNDFQIIPVTDNMLALDSAINKELIVDNHNLTEKAANNTMLSRKELLEVSQAIHLYFAPKITSNQQRLMLLSVDPQHLFAYWSMDGQSSNTLANHLLHNEVVLKIYANVVTQQEEKQTVVTEVTIHDFQAQQFISLPVVDHHHMIDYSATIGLLSHDKTFISLLDSNYIAVAHPDNHCTPSHKSLITDTLPHHPDGLGNLCYAMRNPSGQGNKK